MVASAVPGPSGPPTALTGLTVAGVPTMGMAGLPLTTGRVIFADAVNGSDGNDGSATYPVQTLTQAYSLATAGNNDVIVIVGDGSTAATQRLSAQLVWAKDATHLIGMGAPSMISPRARISTATGATANIANLVSVTAQGCIFSNFSIFQGVGEAATAEQLWQEAGERNYYSYVGFNGMGSANGAAQAASYTLQMYGGSECLFENCYFGADTRDRTAANTNIQLRKDADNIASTRNVWRGCYFSMRATTVTTQTFIDANQSGGIDRFAWFDGCKFTNFGTSTPAAAVAYNAAQGGFVVMDNCTLIGVTDWANPTTATVKVTGAVPNGHTSGIGVSASTT